MVNLVDLQERISLHLLGFNSIVSLNNAAPRDMIWRCLALGNPHAHLFTHQPHHMRPSASTLAHTEILH